MKFSARPLAPGSSGDTWIALMPAHFMYCWYSWLSLPLKGGPPSVLTCSGKPWVANILSMWGMTALAPVLETNSISG